MDPLVSNGTCFYAAGRPASKSFLPCGNAAFGHISCCAAGDMCLSSGACYNTMWDVTYLSGCSDPTYRDQHCPDKGSSSSDSPWLGLIHCDQHGWSACPSAAGKDASASIIKKPFCTCPTAPVRTALPGPQALETHARLPTRVREAISWYPGHKPSEIAFAVRTTGPIPLPIGIATSTDTDADAAATIPAKTACEMDPVESLNAVKQTVKGYGVVIIILCLVLGGFQVWMNWHKLRTYWQMRKMRKGGDGGQGQIQGQGLGMVHGMAQVHDVRGQWQGNGAQPGEYSVPGRA